MAEESWRQPHLNLGLQAVLHSNLLRQRRGLSDVATNTKTGLNIVT